MTPQQAAEHLAAKRTDAPTRYALLTDGRAANCAAKTVAVAYISRADRTEVTALLRSLESPVMPADVEQAIQHELNQLDECKARIEGIEP